MFMRRYFLVGFVVPVSSGEVFLRGFLIVSRETLVVISVPVCPGLIS